MGAVKWSPEQQQIIDDREHNLLVCAAAGAGKTAVLTEHILQLVVNTDTDIDSLLIVTFTNAAAAEMRERLAGKFNDYVEAHPDDRRMQRQLMLLHNASIMTIDSFCLTVVHEFFHMIDLDPAFRIGQEAELSLIRSEVLDDLTEQLYSEMSPGFLSLVESFDNTKDKGSAAELIARLYRCASAHPWPEEWLEEQKQVLSCCTPETIEGTAWMQFIMEYSERILTEALAAYDRAFEIACSMGLTGSGYNAVTSERETARRMLAADTYRERSEIFNSTKSGVVKIGSGYNDYDVQQFKAEREKGKSLVRSDRMKKLFERSTEELCGELELAREPMTALVDAALRYAEAFAACKRDRNIIDFNDLEHFALNILAEHHDGRTKPTQAAEELRRRFKKIFIDEYQDSNFMQEAIVEVIVGKNGDGPLTFMVGDVKQSIYKFRMAKPELFLTRQQRYEEDPGQGRNISLHSNYRSRREVLAATNDVFDCCMRSDIGGIDYDEEARLNPGPDAPEEQDAYMTEVMIVDGPANPDDGEASETQNESAADDGAGNVSEEDADLLEDNIRRLEAHAVAKRIKQLVADELPVRSREGDRPVGYGDIVILLRSNKGWLDSYLEVLAQEGIPAFSDASAGFLKTFEIGVMLNFLRITDNPRQDIPLAAVLHSPMFSFSGDELALIRIEGGREISFYDALVNRAAMYDAAGTDRGNETENGLPGLPGNGDELGRKCANFLKIFGEIRSMNLSRDIDRLINAIYDKTDFYTYCAALPGGARRASNLETLVRYAAEYESSSFTGLFGFVRYVAKLISSELELEEAVSSEAGNCVRLMTIHKSKGLEFPVVFVAGMGKEIRNLDAGNSVITSSDFGIGSSFADLETRIKGKTMARDAISAQMIFDNLGEEERLLYVAMTRAKDKLILVGGRPKKGDVKAKWEAQVQTGQTKYGYTYVSEQKYYFDMVMPAAIMNPRHFSIKTCDSAVLAAESADEALSLEERRSAFEGFTAPQSDEGVIERLSYSYPYGADIILPMKMTVSELKHLSMLEEEGDIGFGESLLPEDAETGARAADGAGSADGNDGRAEVPDGGKTGREQSPVMTGTDRGTLYHKIMQFIPFDIRETGALTAFLDKLEEKAIISSEEKRALNPAKFLTFLKTELCERMCRADERGALRREQPFMIGKRASELKSEYAGFDDLIPVQGVIDCMFEEDGKLVILDYKTDRVPEDREDILIKRYHTQLEYYAEAASRLLGIEVSQKLIYSFALGRVLEV